MTLDDLTLALWISNLSHRNSISSQGTFNLSNLRSLPQISLLTPEAINAIIRAVEECYGKRRKAQLQSVSVSLTPGVALRKIKSMCRGSIDEDVVKSINTVWKAVPKEKWCLTPLLTFRHILAFEECFIFASNWTGGCSGCPAMAELKASLFEMAIIAMSSCKKPRALKERFISTMIDLVFMFRVCSDDYCCTFRLLLGVPGTRSRLSTTIDQKQRVIVPTDIVNFHVELIHRYCVTFNPESSKAMLRSVLACLGVFAEEEAIDHFESFDW